MTDSTEHKHGRVLVDDQFAGIIEEREGLCIFTYDKVYLEKEGAKPISV